MPQRSTSLHILQPCAESWDAMTPTGLGRHCAACQKTVVDFTQKSDAEILAFFEQLGSGKTCGRFRGAQLTRPLGIAALPTPGARWQFWLTGLLVGALTTQSCHTTTIESAPINQTTSPRNTPDSAAVEMARYPIPIQGRVVDDYTRQPVSGVWVHLEGTSFSFVTAADGLFAFPAAATPRATHQNPYVLRLLAKGYPLCEQVLDYALPPPNQPLQIVSPDLPVPTELMGDVDVLR